MDIYSNIQIRFISGSAYLLYRTLRSMNMESKVEMDEEHLPKLQILDTQVWKLNRRFGLHNEKYVQFSAKWDTTLRKPYTNLTTVLNRLIKKEIVATDFYNQMKTILATILAYRSDIKPVIRCIVTNLKNLDKKCELRHPTTRGPFYPSGITFDEYNSFIKIRYKTTVHRNGFLCRDVLGAGFYGTRYIHNAKLLRYACLRKNNKRYHQLCMLNGYREIQPDYLVWDDVLMTRNKSIINKYINLVGYNDKMSYTKISSVGIFKMLESCQPDFCVLYLEKVAPAWNGGLPYMANGYFDHQFGIGILRYIRRNYPDLFAIKAADITFLWVRIAMIADNKGEDYLPFVSEAAKIIKRYPEIEQDLKMDKKYYQLP